MASNYRIEVRTKATKNGALRHAVYGILLRPDGSEYAAEQLSGLCSLKGAQERKKAIEADCLQAEVEAAERRAGWDSKA